MKILISGAGIAGPTLAYWLLRYGFQPTLIESAPKLRTGGYIIDFWGAGFEIANRMGLMPKIKKSGYLAEEVREVARNGKRISGFPADIFSGLTGGRYISIPRGNLAEIIYSSLGGQVETIFGDSISRINQSPDDVIVEFKNNDSRRFDLVIGADGLHSKVREVVFGPQNCFEKYLGLTVAAFEIKGYRPRDELVYVTRTSVGQQVGRFAMRDDRTLFLFIMLDRGKNSPFPKKLADQKMLLNERFKNSGWECAQILEALNSCDDLYFDRVSQIRMENRKGLWSEGRVSLIGDAASAVSFLAGQGTALAMVAAYILAGELHQASGNYSIAFERYQNLFGPFVLRKQKGVRWLAGAFAPKSATGLFVRNKIFNSLGRSRKFASLVASGSLMDRIDLPNY